MSKITVHVVFDTNSIFAGADRLLSIPASNLMRKFSGSTSSEVRWYLPPMVISEREYQMYIEARKLVSAARKGAGFLGLPLDEFTEDKARAQVHRIIEKQINEHRIKEIDFDENLVDWPDLINRAVQREPPFDPDLKTRRAFEMQSSWKPFSNYIRSLISQRQIS